MSVACPDPAAALFISYAKVANRTSGVEVAIFTAADQLVQSGKAVGESPIQVTGCRRDYVGITTSVPQMGVARAVMPYVSVADPKFVC